MRRKLAPHLNARSMILALASLTLVLLALGSTPWTANAQPPNISRDQAVSIVTQTQLGGSTDGVRLFVYPQLLPAGQTVATHKTDVFVTPSTGWFVFVDRHPAANWEHPCWYLFVDAASGNVQRFDAMVPPRLQRDLLEITSGRDNPPDGVSEESLNRFSERLSHLQKPEGTRGQAWALIISGGADQSNNHIRYWNDCAFIYRTLVQYYGYADDHIRVCISDGTNAAVDRSNGTNSPPDLDGDGDADIEYPATTQYITQVFNELATTLSPSDQLFIFTTDHGGQESGHDCYLNLWNWEELRDDQMAALVATIPCQSIICTFEQCFSGGMVDDLAMDGRVIATGANWNEYSWAMGPDYIYDTFVYHWTSAVAWATPAGVPVDADTNNDGIVSMHEAFIYAEAHDFDDETPQYSSMPANLGDLLNLRGNLEGVYLAADHMTIDDDNVGASHGDGDHVIDYGETIELTVALNNMGMSDAFNVIGTLTATSPYVTVVQGVRAYGNIPSQGTVSNPQPFIFSVANDVPNGEALGLTLGVTEEPHTLPLNLTATAPFYAVTVARMSDLAGDDDGVPDPGETISLTLHIQNQGGCVTPDLTAVLGSSEYCVSDEIPHAVGAIQAGQGVDVIGFHVTISPDCPEVYTEDLDLALTGPNAYAASAGVLLMIGPWFDDAELEHGWTIGAAGDAATSGIWVRSDPVGTTFGSPPQQVQPEDDHSPEPGHVCFITGNGTPGGPAGDSDVDGGKTTLVSPVFDMHGATSATLHYWRWYTNNIGNNPNQDYWDVDVTSDGTNWIHLEHTTTSSNSWAEQTFNLGSFISFTSTVRFRFVADDQPSGSLVDAAVDDIMVSIVRSTVGAPEAPALVTTELGACRPNPVVSGAALSYRLAAREDVRLELYDVAGRRVQTLFQGTADAGEHTLSFAPVDRFGRNLASGIYFVRLETPDATQVRQVTIAR